LSQKLLIIVLVVLAVIFLITLGMSGCHGGGTPSPSRAGAVGALKGLQGNRFLVIGDDASANPPSCGVPGGQTLTVNGMCVVTFDKRAFFRKSTRVVFRANAAIRVVIQPNDGPQQDEPLSPLECFASAVNHSGGRMILLGTATVFLQRQPCPE
jgi:hypothetical protein